MRAFLIGLATAALVACGGGDSPTTPSAPTVTGTWSLRTVGGSVLPVVIQASPKVEILADTYTLNADHTYSEAGSIRTTIGNTVGTTSGSEVGVWQQNNTALVLTPTTGGAAYNVSVAGGAFTLTSIGFSFVYGR